MSVGPNFRLPTAPSIREPMQHLELLQPGNTTLDSLNSHHAGAPGCSKRAQGGTTEAPSHTKLHLPNIKGNQHQHQHQLSADGGTIPFPPSGPAPKRQQFETTPATRMAFAHAVRPRWLGCPSVLPSVLTALRPPHADHGCCAALRWSRDRQQGAVGCEGLPGQLGSRDQQTKKQPSTAPSPGSLVVVKHDQRLARGSFNVHSLTLRANGRAEAVRSTSDVMMEFPTTTAHPAPDHMKIATAVAT
ncbi:hypothetical protein IWX49DRAFT_320739 [Phyllosticta citricarpa]|uniref:Uncharacterized protein n=2 Tax=Phyllosticta TaxID=121621 RepID=A0ABR1LI71_9PEZI